MARLAPIFLHHAEASHPLPCPRGARAGLVAGLPPLRAVASWKPEPGSKPVLHRREFPLDNAVVAFP